MYEPTDEELKQLSEDKLLAQSILMLQDVALRLYHIDRRLNLVYGLQHKQFEETDHPKRTGSGKDE